MFSICLFTKGECTVQSNVVYLKCIGCCVVVPEHHKSLTYPGDAMLRKLVVYKVAGKCLDRLGRL